MIRLKTFYIAVLTLITSILGLQAGNSHGVDDANIERFCELQSVLKNVPKRIAGFFSLPYRLPYPVPPIDTAEEFVERIDEVLDHTVRDRLLAADPDDDLAWMGWKGIVLDNGLAWSHKEKLSIYAINQNTQTVLDKRAELIEKVKEFVQRSFLPKLIQQDDLNRMEDRLLAIS